MIDFSYVCSLLFIVIFVLYLISLNIKRSPVKVGYFYNITLVLLLLRYISLIVASLIQEQKIVYMIRPIMLLSFITLPAISLGALYIFFRDEKRKFDYNYLFLLGIVGIYFIVGYLYKIDIRIDSVFGFVVSFKDYLTPNLIYLIMIATLAVISLIFIDKPYSNTTGMRMLTVFLMITIAEQIMFLGGIKLFPYPILGEALMLTLTYKAINTFKI